MTRITHGVYQEGDRLHFFPREFVREHGWPETPENIAAANEVMQEFAREKFPGLVIEETRDG